MLIKFLALSQVERWSGMGLLVMCVFACSVSRVLKLPSDLPIYVQEQRGQDIVRNFVFID